MMRRIILGRTEEKILLILLTGIGLSLTRSSRQYYRLLSGSAREWQKISRQSLPRSVKLLENKKLVKLVRRSDGVFVTSLTRAGEERATLVRLTELKLPILKRWDGLWRVVIFDIPEKKRKVRNVLRECLKQWGFEELQRSVFIIPNPCRDAVELLIHANCVEKEVRFLEVKHLSNDQKVRKLFGLES